MAFRLQSAIAGFAKKASENIDEIEKDYRDGIKNTAANLAQEAALIRKQRMNAVTNYNSTARKLRSRYNLSDGQIQTLLGGGIGEADALEKAVLSGEARFNLDPKNKGQTFDRASFAQALFSTQPGVEATGILDLDQQAQAFASRTAPSTLDLEAAGSALAAGTKTRLTGVSPDVATQALRGRVGALPSDYTGPMPGETGITVSGLGGLTPADMFALEKARADIASTEAGTEVQKAQVTSMGITDQLTRAKAQNMELVNANLPAEQLAALNNTNSMTALNRARTTGAEQDTKVAIIKEQQLKADLDSFKKYNDKDKQLAQDLVEAKIVQARSPADLEQLQAYYLSEGNRLTDRVNQLPEGDSERTLLEAESNALRTRAAGVANMIIAQDPKTASTDWSKGAPEKRFAALLKTNVQNANITGQLNSAGEWEWDFQNKRPAYYTALSNTVDQYSALYADKGKTGLVSSQQNYVQLENTLRQWSQEGNFVKAGQGQQRPQTTSTDVKTYMDYGTKTIDELAQIPADKLIPGDIAFVKDRSGNTFVAMYGTQGEWVSAGDFGG